MMKRYAALVVASLSAALIGAGTAKPLDAYKRPAAIPFPKGNEFSDARSELGRMLFFDPRLSGSQWISCATCHNPALSWGDGLPKGIGHGMKTLGRRTPTILDLAWGEMFFWDGRAATLEEQALGPIAAEGEMNMPHDQMLVKLAAIPGYKALFDKAYPGEGVTLTTIGKAIATYERTVVSGEAPFDRWVKGDQKAISEEAKRGFEVFNGKGRCSKCHSGWRFSDDSFHDIGVADDDIGRAKIVPDVPVLQHAFKTPTLRSVALRAPYMHGGSEATLADVVNFYDRGGDAKRPSQADDVKPLGLSAAEKSDLVAFMNTLNGADKAAQIPLLPR